MITTLLGARVDVGCEALEWTGRDFRSDACGLGEQGRVDKFLFFFGDKISSLFFWSLKNSAILCAILHILGGQGNAGFLASTSEAGNDGGRNFFFTLYSVRRGVIMRLLREPEPCGSSSSMEE